MMSLDEVAPWISLNKEIPESATVEIKYIVYHTSEQEVLVGGRKERLGDYEGTPDDAETDADEFEATADAPDFTKDERKGDGTALLLEARSDGRTNKQQLWLMETSRFSGRYEGYLMLTDENGNDETDANGGPQNWGYKVGAATGGTDSAAAVIGVESGPVEIAYRDTDGKPQVLSILIDTVPPTVQIDNPVHKSEGQDTSPNFSGSFTDDSSGLREDTFRLYVDHNDDLNESGDDWRRRWRWTCRCIPDDVGYGVVKAADKFVESLEDYSGYSMASPTFGVIEHGKVFMDEDDSEG